ncbi:MAG TPA: hypothetical protein VG186_08910 [Solirubrobacteraceae bacterium]|nr:hypothetical protein [Solirubrobacteraceae bacterium]
MAQRSRKRGRREKATAAGAGTDTGAGKRTGATAGAGAVKRAGAAPAAAPARPYARSEARNEAARATLTPYAEGERPWPIVVSAIVATVFGAFNLVSLLIGAKLKVGGQKPGTPGILLFALVMFVCAGGMWRMRYWAVLGFQALLVLVLLTLAILLIKVSNFAGLAVCVVGLTVGGILFFKLVRAMGRMQVPVRERR